MAPTQTPLEREVALGPVPDHVAIIMDGNGRWAQARGLPRLEGHREGAESVRTVTRAARRIGVRALTLYAFSAQNWGRPPEEVEGLMDLLVEYLEGERAELLENDVRLEAVGELNRLPERVVTRLGRLAEDTAHCQGMVLTLCLSYGGREELVEAARRVAREAAAGRLDPERLDAETFARGLWTGGLPEPDLIVRSSGELRLSNFLLWGAAYAELVFSPVAWPEFRDEAFFEAVRDFQQRERRFGLVGAQAPDGL